MRLEDSMIQILRRLVVWAGLVGLMAVPATAAAQVSPAEVDTTLQPGESVDIDKTVEVPDAPASLDVCLLEDESGSFFDDIANLQGGSTASDLYDDVKASVPDAQFAVAGFRDYPQGPFGNPGDHVYRRLSGMSPAKADWLNGINALSAGGGNDGPEGQYDAITAAAGPGTFSDPTAGEQPDCGWRAAGSGVSPVLVVATDAAFHEPGPGKPHVNDQASTITALQNRDITVIGLKAPGAGSELDALAAATGGTTQPLSSDGSDIADAILTGLEELTFDVTGNAVGCEPLQVSFDPAVHQDVSGPTTVSFTETITVPSDITRDDLDENGRIHCTVEFTANGSVIGTQQIWVTVPLGACPTAGAEQNDDGSGTKDTEATAGGSTQATSSRGDTTGTTAADAEQDAPATATDSTVTSTETGTSSADQDSQSSATQDANAASGGSATATSGSSQATGPVSGGDQNTTQSAETNQSATTDQDACTENDVAQDNHLAAEGNVSSPATADPSVSNGGGANIGAGVNAADNSTTPSAGNRSRTTNTGGATTGAAQANQQSSSVEGPDQAGCQAAGGTLVGGVCLQAPIGSTTAGSGDQHATQRSSQSAANNQQAQADPAAVSDTDNSQTAESSASQSADGNRLCAGCGSTTRSSALGHQVAGANSASQLGGQNTASTGQQAAATQSGSQQRTLRGDTTARSGPATANNIAPASTGSQTQRHRHRTAQSAFTLGLFS